MANSTIMIDKKRFREPYSRWKMSESMTAAGLDSLTAYQLSVSIYEDLVEQGVTLIPIDELRSLVLERLSAHEPKVAKRFMTWSRIRHERVPVIILLGGASGIGKSSVALELAHVLGIKQVIGTDTIREIMKNIVAPNLIPALYHSSYEAWRSIAYSVKENKVVVGFREQAAAVSAGVNAAIERSLKEGISLILEGVHLVPELVSQHPNVVMVLLHVENTETHRSRFISRAEATHYHRDAQQYIDSLEAIGEIQAYLKESAQRVGVPVIENKDFETTVSAILDITTQQMLRIMD
ncbi:MAG: 2-phosphoglycerate kinase [Candidatus Methanofastidiosa archaeon]|nr:2-phosphoglycerate kinase [Candidatus Methanofastidiosa archaeon]